MNLEHRYSAAPDLALDEGEWLSQFVKTIPAPASGQVKVVYIAHPLGDDPHKRQINRTHAAQWCAWAAEHCRVCPVAMWVVLSGIWYESKKYRDLGLALDKVLLARCDEVWLVGGSISPGMAEEALAAQELSIPVLDLTALGDFPPDGPLAT
jgi:hypothetical protein